MATTSTSLLMEETGFGSVLKHAVQACPQTLSALYMEHYHHVLKVCRRFFRQREDAEDAAAEVFLKLHVVLEKKDETSPFRPWVSQVAKRHCIDRLRRTKRERESCARDIDPSELRDYRTPTPFSQFLRQEEHRHMREQLKRLPEHYKTPLVLRYYKQMSYSEIARTMGKRLPSVKMIIFRAKGQLRRNLLATTAGDARDES